MQSLKVELGSRSYPILVGPGLLDRAELIVPHLQRRKVLVVTNTTVAPLYLARVVQALQGAGIACLSCELPDGEQYKDWVTLNQIFDALLSNRCERGTTLIALGGGVIGDMGRLRGSLLSAWYAVHPDSDHPCCHRSIRQLAERRRSTILLART